jgi:NADPH:quinone reductase-like Zn-dependent oxidoreductase
MMSTSRRKNRRAAKDRQGLAIPTTMKVAALDRFGPPSVLRLHRLPVPKPGPREVLIALDASGVGIWDASLRDGSWRPYERVRFPLVPGTDGAGIVMAKGARVREFQIGDGVYAIDFSDPQGGFYAEYKAAGVQNIAPVPQHLDLVEAGALPVPGVTGLQGTDDHLRLRHGQTVLIFGASGAVGTLAVQFAKRVRARVLGTASGRDATALVRRLGADAVIDARSEEGIDKLRSLVPDGLHALLALAGERRWSTASIGFAEAGVWHIQMESSPRRGSVRESVFLPTMARQAPASLPDSTALLSKLSCVYP